jgi:hypothetical protein
MCLKLSVFGGRTIRLILITYWYKDRFDCGRILCKPVERRGRKRVELLPWTWRQQVWQKQWLISPTLHGMSQNTVFFVVLGTLFLNLNYTRQHISVVVLTYLSYCLLSSSSVSPSGMSFEVCYNIHWFR